MLFLVQPHPAGRVLGTQARRRGPSPGKLPVRSPNIILLFPLVVYLGAGSEIKGKRGTRFCKFFGDLSYPLYITHDAFIDIYTAWVADHHLQLAQAFWLMNLVLAASLLLAYL